MIWLALLPVFLASCAILPGESPRPPRREDSAHVAWNEARTPDLSGSSLFGVDKLKPSWWLENADTPLEPWWCPDASPEERLKSWKRRNPFHNFTHYLIGVSDRDFVRYGFAADEVWNSHHPLNLALIRSGPLIHLPFISWRGPVLEWYLGWRSGGNFGVALRRSKAEWRIGVLYQTQTNECNNSPGRFNGTSRGFGG